MRNSFVLYTEYAKHIKLLSMEQRGALLTAIMAYETDEEMPEMDGMTQMAFSFIKEQLDRDSERHESTCQKRSEAGKRGGRQKANVSFEEEEKTNESKKSNCFSEKANENNSFEEKEGSLQEKEGGKERNKENPQEREYTLPEKERPPYNPPAGEDGSVVLSDDDLADTVRGYKKFLAEFPSVSVDIMNAGELATVDFVVLSDRMRESKFLQTRYSLRWLIRHFPEIKAGAYADYTRRREEPASNPLFDKYFPEEDVLQ